MARFTPFCVLGALVLFGTPTRVLSGPDVTAFKAAVEEVRAEIHERNSRIAGGPIPENWSLLDDYLRAARKLAATSGAMPIEFLEQVIKDYDQPRSDPVPRRLALATLVTIDSEGSRRMLSNCVRTSPSYVRNDALVATSYLAPDKARAVLADTLQLVKQQKHLDLGVAEALATVGDRSTLVLLTKLKNELDSPSQIDVSRLDWIRDILDFKLSRPSVVDQRAWQTEELRMWRAIRADALQYRSTLMNYEAKARLLHHIGTRFSTQFLAHQMSGRLPAGHPFDYAQERRVMAILFAVIQTEKNLIPHLKKLSNEPGFVGSLATSSVDRIQNAHAGN